MHHITFLTRHLFQNKKGNNTYLNYTKTFSVFLEFTLKLKKEKSTNQPTKMRIQWENMLYVFDKLNCLSFPSTYQLELLFQDQEESKKKTMTLKNMLESTTEVHLFIQINYLCSHLSFFLSSSRRIDLLLRSRQKNLDTK